MYELDFSKLPTASPLTGDEWIPDSFFSVEDDIRQLQAEADAIAIDSIPFDKSDAAAIFFAALVEILMDTFVGDSANPNSLASKLNDSHSAIGKWCNSIHEKIPHKNNPMDYQGGFDVNGNPVFHNSGKHSDISFSGGDHRVRTKDHDILRFVHAIRDYHYGVFRDGGYVDGKYIEVMSAFNSKGNPFEPTPWGKAIVKYLCHMFADFFSSKGLPIPGSSFLSHASDRELRILAEDIYKEGLNMRTQVLQSSAFLIADLVLRIYVKLKYRDTEYSEQAISAKKHLMLLSSNSLSTAWNIGKVVFFKNPESINIPMIVHTLRLCGTCIKDRVEFNQRVISKVYLDSLIRHLQAEKTIIIAGAGFYRTVDYLRVCAYISTHINEELDERQFCSGYLELAIQEYNELMSGCDMQSRATEMDKLTSSVQVSLSKTDSLESIVNNSTITIDNDSDNLIKLYNYAN